MLWIPRISNSAHLLRAKGSIEKQHSCDWKERKEIFRNGGTLENGVFERNGKSKVHILKKSGSLFQILDARRVRVQNVVVYEAWRPKSVHPCGKR